MHAAVWVKTLATDPGTFSVKDNSPVFVRLGETSLLHSTKEVDVGLGPSSEQGGLTL